MRRSMVVTALATILAIAGTGPVAAGGDKSVRFGFEDSYLVQHACGIVEHTTVSAIGTAFFDASGDWIRDRIVFAYEGVYVGPSGAAFANKTNQVAVFTPATGTLTGQGLFMHGGHIGTLVMDVGRIVFASGSGSTLFATPKVIPFDDPGALAAVDEALCDLIG